MAHPGFHPTADAVDGALPVHSSAGPPSVVSALRSMRRALDNLQHRQTGRDPKTNAYAFAEVPDWQLRQWIDALEYINRPHPEWCGAISEDEPCPDCGATAEFGVCQSIRNRPKPGPLIKMVVVRRDTPPLPSEREQDERRTDVQSAPGMSK